MIDLHQQAEPYDLELPYGVHVTVRPLSTAGMAAAQAAVRRAVEAIERQARDHLEAGLPLDGLPDLSADGERDGFYQAQLIRELAVRHVTNWEGVELGGGPAPPTLGERRGGHGALSGTEGLGVLRCLVYLADEGRYGATAPMTGRPGQPDPNLGATALGD